MKVVVTQENLHKAMNAISRVVSNRVSLPILGNVLLQTDNGRLKLSATDLEIGLTTQIGAKVESDGAITVPCRAFNEFVGSVFDSTITLETSELILKLSSERNKANLRGVDAEEYPVIPSVDKKSDLSVTAAEFLSALKQVTIAAATDDTRPVLAGILLNWSEDQLILAATDSYRLAEKRLKLAEKVAEEKAVIVPIRCVNELIRVLSGYTQEKVSITIKDNQILFAFGDVEIVSRLIDGKYPDYVKIIPDKKTTTITVSAELFRQTLRSASIFAKESANTAKLVFNTAGTLAIKSTASNLGDTETTAAVEVDGEDVEANFNIKYLLDAVSVITDEKVEFGLSGKFSAALLVGVGSPDFRYVIMPLKTE
ncbi:MAG: DNA polymerase III subunit beta [Patescibacteria group bacterium]|jgi:DNA polymerase-3 subunit beta